MTCDAKWHALTMPAAAAALALLAAAATAEPYADLVKYDFAQGRAVPARIEAEIRAAATARARRAIEGKLVGVLTSREATFEGKQFACRMLRRVGSSACVPAAAGLLTDPKLSHAARLALQHLPGAEAGAALRAALARTKGALRLGVIGSLGERGEDAAVPALARLAAGADAETARAAIQALGRIAGDRAARALDGLSVPPALRTTWADAQLRCADRLLAGKRFADAAAIYRRFFAAGQPKWIRVAALRGLVMADGPRAVGHLRTLMAGRDDDLRRAARKFAVEAPGPAATRALAEGLADAQSREQIAILGVLTERGDTAAAAAVARLARSRDEDVRVAAIRALAALGDASSVPMLARLVAGGGDVGKAASETLNRLKGPGVGEAMSKLLDSPDAAFRAAILRVLTARADKTMVPAMLKAATDRHADVRKAAVKGLETVAGGKEMPSLVSLFLAAKDDADRAALKRAVSAAGMRVDDLDARSAPVVAGLARARGQAKADLLSLLGGFGGPKALRAVRACLADADAEVASAAVRALAGWGDDAPAADLLKIIRTTSDRVHKVLAFRGYVRMAGLTQQRSSAEAVAMYRQALALAATDAEKKSVLAGLGSARSVEALKLVEPLLAHEGLRGEAELAYVQIASNARDNAPDEARAAIRKVLAATKSDTVRRRARAALNEMDKYRGYVTSWLGSGPYTGGSPYGTAYPPEKGDQAVRWKRLTKGVGPQMIDLKQAIGSGENRAAYMKTNVHSPVEQDVRLELGSDDGIKVWVNGKRVHANNASRPCKPAEDKATARLKKGWNAVRVKISQGGGDWAFSVRICRPDGAALEGLRVSTDGK